MRLPHDRRLHPTRRSSPRAAHTLVELVLVMALLSVLAMIGWSSARHQVGAFRLMGAARMLQSDVQGLRALAIAQNREARVLLVEADPDLDPAEPQVGMWLLQVGDRSSGSTEWDTLPLDEGGVADGSQGERSLDVDGSEERPGISVAPWSPLAGPGLGNADAIVFSPRGFVANPASDFAGGFITVQLVNKYGELAGDGSYPHVNLRIARGGLAHMETSEGTALADGSVGAGGTTTQ
jgi:type II secretory pathway pseudopilin PulG